jgi:hypothetical protein
MLSRKSIAEEKETAIEEVVREQLPLQAHLIRKKEESLL